MISIIILTFNSMEYIKSCLDSVFSQDFSDFEVILVNNGSEDGTLSFIKENYPQVILIENKKNLGACKARNQGIGKSSGEWILTLDCDVTLRKDFFKEMINSAEKSDKSVGSFQPKILTTDKKTIYSCGISLSYLKRFHDIGKNQHDNGKFDKNAYIFGACSAAVLYKRRCLMRSKKKPLFGNN